MVAQIIETLQILIWLHTDSSSKPLETFRICEYLIKRFFVSGNCKKRDRSYIRKAI